MSAENKKRIWNYQCIDSEPYQVKRKTNCAGCSAPLVKGDKACRVFFAGAYYTRTKTFCLSCEIPDEIEE